MKPPSSDALIPEGLTGPPDESFNPGKTMVSRLLWEQMRRDETMGIDPDAVQLARILESEKVEGEDDDSTRTTPDRSYRMMRLVGEGGFGEVWEATQDSLGRVIALKRLKRSLSKGLAANSAIGLHLTSSFRQEALTTGALEHPNIVPVYDLVDDENGMPQMAMKLVRGRHWDEALDTDFAKLGTIEFLARHLPTLIHVANAVAFAHSRGVVHRDIKPSQVMLGEFGEVLLMDWGLALVFDMGKAELQGPQLALSEFTPWSPSVTSPAGTPAYMAPEQTEEAAVDVGPWTDVYLLGGCLYFVLTNLAPHEDETSEKSFARAMKGQVRRPSEVVPDRKIPRDLETLCLKALSIDRHERPSAREFIEGLNDYLTGASRRREAGLLVEEAAEIAGRSWSDYSSYEELAHAINLLDQALSIDPDNARGRGLRQQVIIQFARLAIANNDLRLARFQADRLEDGTERRRVLGEIDQLTQKQQAAQKSVEQLYARAARQRDQAEEARMTAENAVAALLHLLVAAQAQSGRSMPGADDVAQQVMRYLDRHPERRPTREVIQTRTAAYRAAGEVLSQSGDVAGALKAFRAAEELLKGSLTADPRDRVLSSRLEEIRERIERMSDTDRAEKSDTGPRALTEFETMRQELLEHLDKMLET